MRARTSLPSHYEDRYVQQPAPSAPALTLGASSLEHRLCRRAVDASCFKSSTLAPFIVIGRGGAQGCTPEKATTRLPGTLDGCACPLGVVRDSLAELCDGIVRHHRASRAASVYRGDKEPLCCSVKRIIKTRGARRGAHGGALALARTADERGEVYGRFMTSLCDLQLRVTPNGTENWLLLWIYWLSNCSSLLFDNYFYSMSLI